MKMHSLLSVFVLLFALCLTSCEKEEIIENPISLEDAELDTKPVNVYDLKVEDGNLVFESSAQMRATYLELSKYDEVSLDDWERSIGFESYRSKFNQLVDQLDTFNTESELTSFLNMNSDAITLQDGIPTPVSVNESYFNILGTTGTYRINAAIYYVAKDRIVSVGTNDVDLLERAKQSAVSNIDLGFSVEPIIETQELRSGCGIYVGGDDTNDDGNRKIVSYKKVQVTTTHNWFVFPSGAGVIVSTEREVDVIANMRSYKKRWWGWKRHKADLSWSMSCEVDLPGQTNYSFGTSWGKHDSELHLTENAFSVTTCPNCHFELLSSCFVDVGIATSNTTNDLYWGTTCD